MGRFTPKSPYISAVFYFLRKMRRACFSFLTRIKGIDRREQYNHSLAAFKRSSCLLNGLNGPFHIGEIQRYLLNNDCNTCFDLTIKRCSSSNHDQQRQQSGFIQKLVHNVREEIQKNKELQDHKRQLDQKLKELNETEALKDARRKYDIVERETIKSSEMLKEKLDFLRQQLSAAVAEVGRTETGKKLSEASESLLTVTRDAAEAVEKAAVAVGDTALFKQAASSMKAVKDEIDQIADVRMYSRPDSLRMRSQHYSTGAFASRTFEANREATGIELHKESRWYQSWKDFSETNAYFNKLLDWKIRFDESENPLVRIVRGASERVYDIFSSRTDVSQVLTEINKIDPSFDKMEWLRFCEKEIIPNVLEAVCRQDLPVLKDWCYERAYLQFSIPIEENIKIGYSAKDSRVIDISRIELEGGKMMEHGPVLIISFQVFMIDVVKTRDGKVLHGNESKPVRVHHVWVLCRDMEELNPDVAWKVLEMHSHQGELAI